MKVIIKKISNLLQLLRLLYLEKKELYQTRFLLILNLERTEHVQLSKHPFLFLLKKLQLHHERTEERRKLVKGKQDTESSATNIHEKWKKILGTVYILGE